ncbi:hypothetical protein Taro_008402, partial [Colocasia esculenta]|nr:hypothetical protein [Colocasia esculenta]
MLQDIGNWDLVVPQDKWFTYDDPQEKLVEKYVYSSRSAEASLIVNEEDILYVLDLANLGRSLDVVKPSHS